MAPTPPDLPGGARPGDDFLSRLLAAFRAESAERLATLDRCLADLPGAGEAAAELLESAYRETHSLKGAARSVGLIGPERLCQSLENVFSGLKRGRLFLSPELLDLLQVGSDLTRAMIEGDDQSRAGAAETAALALIERLNAAAAGSPAGAESRSLPLTEPPVQAAALSEAAPPAASPPPATQDNAPPPAPAPGTVRVEAGLLDAMLLQAEELLPLCSASEHATSLAIGIAGGLGQLRERLAGDAEAWAGRADRLGRAPSDLLQQLESLERGMRRFAREAYRRQDHLRQVSNGILSGLKAALLTPFAALVPNLRYAVRELGRDLGKKVRFEIDGEGQAIDRRVLDELRDPFLHLVRNAVDHGLETPTERLRAGKPAEGLVRLTFQRSEQDTILVELSDDGRGMDPDAARRAAASMGLVSSEEARGLSDGEALRLLFVSGLTTSEQVTSISGRGLGLAIAKERVERLGGEVRIASETGRGTRIGLTVPVALRAIRGLVVMAGGRRYIIPQARVVRVRLVLPDEPVLAGDRATILEGDRRIPYQSLAALLGLPAQPEEAPAPHQSLVCGVGGNLAAFWVESIVGEEDLVVKPLGAQIKRAPLVSGAAMLADGVLAPVLYVPDLVGAAAGDARARPPAPQAARRRRLLVAEDSLTSRMLLKNVLETAGYDVMTAVDGLDAMAKALEHDFDLVVSDVEMPGLDGFGLTERLRKDQRTAALPVILVTSLDTREHRERGLDAGADAYIVKSRFDQGNLLQVIRKLI